jgi:hypothetical protein
VTGLYLLHFDPRYKHAGHYLGYADDIARRVQEHLSCGSKSSPLVKAAVEAGCDIQIARVWPGGSRTEERRLKNVGSLVRQCPTCKEGFAATAALTKGAKA